MLFRSDIRVLHPAPFPMSKDDSPTEIVAQADPYARNRRAASGKSDDNKSDDDPLLMNRDDEIINRGGFAPFPMSLKDRPEPHHKGTSDDRRECRRSKKRRSSG